MELFASGTIEPRRLSLARLSGELGRAAAGLGRISVEGEVSGPRPTGGGAVFFTLRDRAARMDVVCPASRTARCRTVPGERVLVTGRVEYRAAGGRVQLVAEEAVPVGAGAMAAAAAEVRERLRVEGLLDRPKRALPALPAAVGVVCGGGSAVRADIESVVSSRFAGYPIVFDEVRVSGPGAPDEMIRGIGDLDCRPDVEVIVLARGGGDAAELFVFNDEALCRAIAACATPVVSAIGHDGDRPLCDEVADLRCATPSLAAEAVVPDERGLWAGLESAMDAAGAAACSLLTACEARLDGADPLAGLDKALSVAAGRLGAAGAGLRGVALGSRVATEDARLRGVRLEERFSHQLELAERELAARAGTIDALDPLRVLERGYAVVRVAGGEVVRSPEQVRAGDPLEISLAAGTLRARADGSP